MQFYREWTDFYQFVEVRNYIKKTEYFVPSDKNVYFADSNVEGLTNRVICYAANSNTRLLLESCKFDDISVTYGHGAVIYFGSAGEVVHNKVCSNQCKQYLDSNDNAYSGVYSYHFVTNNLDSKNYIIESSIIKSFSENGGITMMHHYGNMKLSKSNLTDSDTSETPCIYFHYPSQDVNISYMKFSNNKGQNKGPCSFHVKNSYLYSFCDILNNQCQQTAVLYFEASCDFSSCNIVNNVATPNILFYLVSGYSITTTSCYINNPNARENVNANSVQSVQNPIEQPLIKIRCEYINKGENCHASCRRSYYLENHYLQSLLLFCHNQ